MRTFPLLLAALLLLCSSAFAQTYRWTDSSGKTVFSDTPPPAKARNVKSVDEGAAADDASLPYATREAARNSPVTLFTADNCIDACRQARELLNARRIPFSEKTVQSQDDAAELKQLIGDLSVPTLKVGRQTVRGFLAPAYDNLLDIAGYPKKPGSSSGDAQ